MPSYSMETAAAEEAAMVMELLKQQAGQSTAARASSPMASPRSPPPRSMLDVDSPVPLSPSSASGHPSRRAAPVPQIRSMLDVAGPLPPTHQVRSMLDVSGPSPPSRSSRSHSAQTSPVTESHNVQGSASGSLHPRSSSDAAARPPVDPVLRQRASPGVSAIAEYQFCDIITTNTGQAMPKRNTLGPTIKKTAPAAPPSTSDRGRQFATHSGQPAPSFMAGRKSKSPHGRFGRPNRTSSPHASLSASLGTSSSHSRSMYGVLELDNGLNVDAKSAFRKLSDAQLLKAGDQSLSDLTTRSIVRQQQDTGRLEKSYVLPNGEVIEDSSEDDSEVTESDDDDRGQEEEPRGRDASGGSRGSNSGGPSRPTLSLLAAAEEERKTVASKAPQMQYRSLLDDALDGPRPGSGGSKSGRATVHPATSFDDGNPGGVESANESEDELAVSEIQKAQRMEIKMSAIKSDPERHRSIRFIQRGDWAKLHREREEAAQVQREKEAAEAAAVKEKGAGDSKPQTALGLQPHREEHRQFRKYLVATDLSAESTHALEWTVGTVLRDGDTLLAIYCVDEETGVVTNEASMVPDEPRAMKEHAAALVAATRKGSSSPAPSLQTLKPSPLDRGGATGRLGSIGSGSPAPSRERGKAEDERDRAVRNITDRVVRLLRKTRLQVRVIVEVIHCKSPKHLITEVIDTVEPTLVILGSRGRSALKGVVLGSFSNYLVTKSSVPVMVARKKLRKQSKLKRPVTQVNNLSNPRPRTIRTALID